MSMFEAADMQIPFIRDDQRRILTQNFLGVCRLSVPVLEKFGTAFYPVRVDIGGNIDRLHTRFQANQQQYQHLFTIVEEEVSRRDHEHGKSCTKGLLWLKRAMEFMLAILRQLAQDPSATLPAIVQQQYTNLLYPYHGFFTSSAFTVAFQFVPSREHFLEQIAGASGTVAMQQMQQFIEGFAPVLADIHKFLDERGLNDPAKV